MDISAALTAPFVPADSVPGHVTLGCGGVARNIAHNLRLMGNEVRFVSIFGGDTFGRLCWQECPGTESAGTNGAVNAAEMSMLTPPITVIYP